MDKDPSAPVAPGAEPRESSAAGETDAPNAGNAGAAAAAAAGSAPAIDEKAIEEGLSDGVVQDDLSENDPNVVSWDGPDDPENPLNWPAKKKWLNIAVLSVLTIITPLGSSMFAPGVPEVMADFHSTSQQLATFVVSIYVLGFAFGPLLAAPLSELYGRAPLYNIGNALFVVFTIGTALSKNMGMIIAFRFLMGFAGCVPITIGSGTIADMMPIEERGKAMAVWALGPLLGPCVGPVAGGYLVQAKGWRWVFWVIAILDGLFLIISIFCLRETFAPVLLEKKTARLRKETGNQDLRSKLHVAQSATKKISSAILKPLELLVTTPIVTLMSLYVAVAYAILYLLISTFTFVYEEQYGFSQGDVGLSFIPAGIGMMIGVGVFGSMTDRIIKNRQRKGLELKPEHRLMPYLTIPSGLALPIGLLIYGWAAEKGVHWVVPMLGVIILSTGMIGVMLGVQTYLVDCYTRYAASAIAANTVLRSLAGALLPLCALQMYQNLGLGWGNSLLAFIALALVPIPLAFYIYGERIRTIFDSERFK